MTALRLTTIPALLAVLPLTAQEPRPVSMAGRAPVHAPNGVAATSQPLATEAALEVLRRGGNAIDAAVTAAAVLTVVEPMMTGIGGDMFAMVWSAKEGRLVGLNASGRAGALMTREELLKRGRTRVVGRSAESITVPGALAGWQALLARYGTITLAQALEPAIRYAEQGFPVTPVIAADWIATEQLLARDAGARSTYLIADGEARRAPRAGEWFANPDYARTLRGIARAGPRLLYGGALGERIVRHVRAAGGFLTIEDMTRHTVDWVTPISTTYKGYRVWEMPPSNQGIAALEMLRILEPYDLKALGHNSAAYLHRIVEAKKLAYADLARYVGDPAHVTTPMSHLLSDEFVSARRRLIDTARAAARVEPGPARTASETIYLTVADSMGNMVSFINSLYDEFGSGIVVPGTGFALHDRGAGFTLEPGLPNTVAPGKRPFHTLIPAFVSKPAASLRADGRGDQPWMSFGVMGGAMQAQGHVQVLLNLIVFGMDVQQAIDAGRVRHLDGLRIMVEPVLSDEVRARLRAMGHDITTEPFATFGGAQAIIKLPRGWVAGSDPRKDGHAAGY